MLLTVAVVRMFMSQKSEVKNTGPQIRSTKRGFVKKNIWGEETAFALL